MAYRSADVPADAAAAALARLAAASRNLSPELALSIHDDLGAIEAEWRAFEQAADCTAFQTFDYLDAWQRHIGRRLGVVPAVAVGRYADGGSAFIIPLAVAPSRLGGRLCWLGQDLCDYNAPLLACDFSQRVGREGFLAAWHELRRRLRRDPQYRHHWIELEQMPQTVGTQLNPFTYLAVARNASGAHLTELGANWEAFYRAKRSSATRRRDRAKRKHMSEFGDVRFATCTDAEETRRTLETLFEQKSRSFARWGIADMFAQPGCREFFLELACNPALRQRFHVSRIEVGATVAAANFGVVFGDSFYHVLASYEDSAALTHYGPGAMHLRELLAYAIGCGLRRFDFTVGDEPYKKEWSDANLDLYDHSAAATWRGYPAHLVSIVRRRIKRFVKQTPWAWRLAVQLRAALHRRPPPGMP
jgi:CelD/BcsL family acetyltransferase involved in cellulose biosynthesis